MFKLLLPIVRRKEKKKLSRSSHLSTFTVCALLLLWSIRNKPWHLENMTMCSKKCTFQRSLSLLFRVPLHTKSVSLCETAHDTNDGGGCRYETQHIYSQLWWWRWWWCVEHRKMIDQRRRKWNWCTPLICLWKKPTTSKMQSASLSHFLWHGVTYAAWKVEVSKVVSRQQRMADTNRPDKTPGCKVNPQAEMVLGSGEHWVS